MDRLYIKLRNLDAYPKINEDFFSRTLSGGVITLASSIFILILFISEFSIFTVAGIVDSFVYHGRKVLQKKREIGKAWMKAKHYISRSKDFEQLSRTDMACILVKQRITENSDLPAEQKWRQLF